jgi:hypothetical protein
MTRGTVGGSLPCLREQKAPASEGGRLYVGFERDLLLRRVALAERPSGREARSVNSASLFCR